MDLSIVIPTYNSELIIEKLLKKIYFGSAKSFEIIVVNDSSQDNTYEVLKGMEMKFPNLKIVNLKKNIGQVGATIVGVNESVGKIILTMDDDLQHNPKYIEKLVREIENSDYEFVIAKWGLDETIVRNLGSYFFSIISSLLVFKSIKFRNTAFRAFKKENKEQFVKFFISRYWIDPRRLRAKIVQVEIEHDNQNFRPYSSFRSRIKLAMSHIFFDSYLIHFFLILIFYEDIFLLGAYIFVTTIFQNLNRLYLKRKRWSAFY